MNEMVVTSIRLSAEMLKALHNFAYLESLKSGKRVTWSAILRSLVQDQIIARNPGLTNHQLTESRPK